MARILLVDDDPALLSALPEALSRRLPTCEIVTADCGETALSLLKHGGACFDLLISDMLIAGMGCMKLVEVIEQLRPCVPTIIMTGMIETPSEKVPASAVGVIRKPFDVSKVAQMVRGVLEKKSVSQS